MNNALFNEPSRLSANSKPKYPAADTNASSSGLEADSLTYKKRERLTISMYACMYCMYVMMLWKCMYEKLCAV